MNLPTFTREPAVPWTPRVYQRRSLRHLLEQAAVAFFADPGLGKTSTILAMMKVLIKKKIVRDALVVAPLRVCRRVWPAEVAKWTDFDGQITTALLHGKDRLWEAQRGAHLSLINPEGLEWYLDALIEGEIRRIPDVLVLDESTLFKNQDSLRSQRLKTFVSKFRRRYALTGTPASNSLLDLFNQVYMLDLGATFGGLYYAFRGKYFREDEDGRWVPKEGAEEAIYRKLGPLCIRLDERDYLDLPPCQEIVLEVELPAKAVKAYEQFEKELVVDLEEGRVLASNAAAATSKLRQIASGAVYGDDGVAVPIHGAKVSAVLEVVRELHGRPLLVFWEWKHERDAIEARLEPGTWAELGDRTNAVEEAEIQRRFDRGELAVLLVHPKSGGYGLNLQKACSTQFWTSGTWIREQYAQGVKRTYRQGQTRPVTIYRCEAVLPTRPTLDELVWRRVDQKGATEQRLLDALNDYYKVRTKSARRKA